MDIFAQRVDSTGATLNRDNFDQLILAGDIIRRIIVSFEAVVDSNMGLNLRWGIDEIYTERPTSGAISEMVDEDDCGIPDASSVTSSLSRMTIAQPEPAQAPAPTSEAVDEESEEVDEDECEYTPDDIEPVQEQKQTAPAPARAKPVAAAAATRKGK
jgi:hypothetical protein